MEICYEAMSDQLNLAWEHFAEDDSSTEDSSTEDSSIQDANSLSEISDITDTDNDEYVYDFSSDKNSDDYSNESAKGNAESEVHLKKKVLSETKKVAEKEEKEEEEEDTDGEWSDPYIPRDNEAFKGSPKLNMCPQYDGNVEDIVSMFIGDDLFDFIAEETNRYHAQNAETCKVKEEWYDVTVPELKHWYALTIITTFQLKRNLKDHWDENDVSTSVFAQTMNLNRYKDIRKFLHFYNNEDTPNDATCLFKVQRVIDYFAKKFEENCEPGRDILLDMDIINWGDNRYFSPKMLSNDIMEIVAKCGILTRLAIDGDTGYILKFKFDVDLRSSGELCDAVLDISSSFWNKGHHLYVCGFFNSVELAEKLLAKNTRMCGALTLLRNVPKVFFKNVQLKLFETLTKRKGEIVAERWKIHGGMNMYMVSTIHNGIVIDTGKIDRNTGRQVHKPKSLIDYEEKMKLLGADKLAMSSSVIKKNKWPSRVVFYLLTCALSNAYTVYERTTKKERDFNFFLRKIIESWITNNMHCDIGEAAELSKSSNSVKRFIKIPTVHGQKMKICRACYQNNIKRRTKLMCKCCRVPLHLGQCFALFHANL